MSNRIKMNKEEERRIIHELTRTQNQSEYNMLQNRLEVKTPLPPVIKKGVHSKIIPKEEKPKNLINHKKANSKSINSVLEKDLKKSMQLPEKLAIDCNNTLNTSMISQRSSKSLKLFNLTDDANNSEDDSNNPFNKIAQQQKEYQFFQLDNFLKSIELSKLFQLFVKNRITDILTINTLTDDKLVEMKITKDNRNKILNRINELSKPSNGDGANHDAGIQSNAIEKEDNIVDFDENERIQAELFKKAVEEFRRGGKDYVPPPTEEEEEKPKVENPKKFLMNLGGKDLFNLNSISVFQDEGNDIKDDSEYLAELAIGRACWTCFKKIYEAFPKKIDDKYFCGIQCSDKYQKENEIKCDFCNKNYYKNNGLYHKQNKFCSIDCFQKDKNKIIENKEEEDEDDESNQPKEKAAKEPFSYDPSKLYLNDHIDILDI